MEDDYLNAEPMYNNLEAMWRQNQHQQKKKEVDAFSQEFDIRMKITAGNQNSLLRSSSQGNQAGNNGAGSGTGQPELRSNTTNGNNLRDSQRSQQHHSSTMPRPASIQPTMHHSTRFVHI